jgi:hypothetical protein
LSVNASDALSKLRVSEKPSQSEYSAGGDSEGRDSEGGDSESIDSESDSESVDSAEASLSIIISFDPKMKLYLPSTSRSRAL